MHKVGLHGKSFIPLVMGFGCNVPAVMATKSIESRSSRIITALILPFISCSARLPVYILFLGCFFGSNSGTILFGLYLLGIVVAMITSLLLRKFCFSADETPFVMGYYLAYVGSLCRVYQEFEWRNFGGIGCNMGVELLPSQ